VVRESEPPPKMKVTEKSDVRPGCVCVPPSLCARADSVCQRETCLIRSVFTPDKASEIAVHGRIRCASLTFIVVILAFRGVPLCVREIARMKEAEKNNRGVISSFGRHRPWGKGVA
jgi:hypothetical protein